MVVSASTLDGSRLTEPLPAPLRAPGTAGPVAVFDSGVGGLSVLRHIRALLPHEHLLYLADQAHVPYGPRPASEIAAFTQAIAGFLLHQGAKLIVVACNTATAAALGALRQHFPRVSFVGMEPAVKPGATRTRTGKVGVLATAGTFESQRYASLMSRFARDVTLYENPCTGLVLLIEEGRLVDPQTQQLLASCLGPMLAAGIDTLVLGCTHYPFVLPLIEALVGPDVIVIDPAPAVARQTGRVLQQQSLVTARQRPGRTQAYTTGDPARFAAQTEQLLGIPLPVEALHWQKGELQPL